MPIKEKVSESVLAEGSDLSLNVIIDRDRDIDIAFESPDEKPKVMHIYQNTSEKEKLENLKRDVSRQKEFWQFVGFLFKARAASPMFDMKLEYFSGPKPVNLDPFGSETKHKFKGLLKSSFRDGPSEDPIKVKLFSYAPSEIGREFTLYITKSRSGSPDGAKVAVPASH